MFRYTLLVLLAAGEEVVIAITQLPTSDAGAPDALASNEIPD